MVHYTIREWITTTVHYYYLFFTTQFYYCVKVFDFIGFFGVRGVDIGLVLVFGLRGRWCRTGV